MRHDEREIDDELRGHLALAIRERVERGENPDAARRAALRELVYIGAVRDSVRRVWHSRWADAFVAGVQDVRVGLRSLRRAWGLSFTVVATLALGIGANAAVFSVVRGVLLRPLVNRDEDRPVYIRQRAPGIGTENALFSVPEIRDLEARARTIGALVDPVTKVVRELSPEQPVERAATLEDVRAEFLAPERLNALVFAGLAGMALSIAVVGVSGVLAFSVVARTREFGVRLAVGSSPGRLLARVLAEGASIAATGIVAGAAAGFLLGRVAATYFDTLRVPTLLAVLAAAGVLAGAAMVASLVPATRAARVDVLQALRSE